MKVAFYCDFNKNMTNKIEDLEEGNIGIGGTQYLYLLIVSNLQKKNIDKENTYVLLTNCEINVKKDIVTYKNVESINEAYTWCENNKYEYLVIRANKITSVNENNLKNGKTKIILWAHNYVDKSVEKILYENENIVKLICVSKQQYINLRSSIAYSKMTYINNCIGSYIDSARIQYKKNNNIIYYIGAVEPNKGIHELIKIFSSINKKNPNTRLMIIGGIGKLRAKEIELGKMQITYKEYEKKIIALINKRGLNARIEFKGVLDAKQIRNIIKDNGGIGVVSVSRPLMGETFCMTALELESYGIPVIARKRCDGLSTSICNEYSGFLEKKDSGIIKDVDLLIKNEHIYREMSCNAIKYAKTFSVTSTIEKWCKLFENLQAVPTEYKESLFVKFEKMINKSVITPREFFVRIQTKVLNMRYKGWMK